jgi:hypothetical protein
VRSLKHEACLNIMLCMASAVSICSFVSLCEHLSMGVSCCNVGVFGCVLRFKSHNIMASRPAFVGIFSKSRRARRAWEGLY